jgi:HSP20 family protein
MWRNRPLSLFYSQNPWREIDRMQRDMNRLMQSFPSFSGAQVAPSFPAINVWLSEEGAVVTAELPGVKPEDLDISVVGETLTLTGSRQPEELKEGEKYHRRERRFGKFTRTFQLPFTVEANNVDAKFDKGILHIALPRAEAEKPRKISVKTA